MSSKDENTPAEDKPLTVDDIPGAVPPSAESSDGAGAEGSLSSRLSAFRERRTGGSAGGAASGPLSARRVAGAMGGGGAAAAAAGAAAAGGGAAGRRQQLAARRAGGAGGGGRGPAIGGRQLQSGGGEGDPIERGREILKQLISRMNQQGEQQKPMQRALKGVARGYQALEAEVKRLQSELDSYR